MSPVINKLKAFLSDRQTEELFRGGLAAFSLRIIGICAGYAFTLLVTRGLGAEAMGIFALSYTVLQVAALVGRGGLDSAMMRYSAELTAKDTPWKLKGVYSTGIKTLSALGVLLCVVVYVSAPFLAEHVFGKPHLSPYFRIASLGIIPMTLLQLNAGGLRGLKKVWQFSFLNDLSIFLFASIIFGAFFIRQIDASDAVTALVAALYVSAALSFVLWWRNAPYSGSGRTSGITLRDMLDIGIPLMLAGSMSFIMQWTDTLMLGVFRPEEEVGVYAVASRVAKLATLTLFAVNIIAAPKFAELYGTRDHEKLEQTVQGSTRMIFWSSLPLVLVLLLAPSFILGIFGREFTAGVPALYVLTVGQLIWTASGLVGTLLAMTGHQHTFRNIMLFSTVMNILLNLSLIPPFGINGAALATALSLVTWNLLGAFFVKKHLSISSFYLPVFFRKSS